MVPFSFWQRWLQGIGLLVIVLGLFMAFLIGTDALSVLADPIDQAFFNEALTAVERDFQAWTYGVWGATMVGWGIVLMFIARGPFTRKELWSWQAFAVGLLAWFIIDTAFSAFYDVMINVIVNVTVMMLALVPLLATYKEFRPAAA